jgi:hypothetical protein
MQNTNCLFLRKEFGFETVKALALIYFLLNGDRRALEGLDFHAGFTADDEPLKKPSEVVSGMPIW